MPAIWKNVLCRVVMPTFSMSPVRTHFCTLVARGNGGVVWPRKYGLNGAMPAMVNSTVASWLISDADGTTVWPVFSKWPRKRRRISWVCMGPR